MAVPSLLGQLVLYKFQGSRTILIIHHERTGKKIALGPEAILHWSQISQFYNMDKYC